MPFNIRTLMPRPLGVLLVCSYLRIAWVSFQILPPSAEVATVPPYVPEETTKRTQKPVIPEPVPTRPRFLRKHEHYSVEESYSIVTRPMTPKQKKEAAINHRVKQVERTLRAQRNTTTPFAYAFVLGGVQPGNVSYKGFLYSILVARRLLLEEGSTMDAILFVQMAHGVEENLLPTEDVMALEALRIQIQYLPATSSFKETVLSKFRILSLTQYQRVLFLDADVMPVSNLDYWFNHSVSGKWKENVVVAGVAEPAHGGAFLLQPKRGDWEALQQMSFINETVGWGHEIREPDEWQTREWLRGPVKRGRKWTFNGAQVDQGLCKYYCLHMNTNVLVHGLIIVFFSLQYTIGLNMLRSPLVLSCTTALSITKRIRRVASSSQ